MWLRTAHAPRRAARPTSFHPRLQPLEARECPTAGALDPTFGSGGVLTRPTTRMVRVHDTAVQPDGKIVSAGWVPVTISQTYKKRTVTSEKWIVAVERLNPNGAPDATFGSAGLVTLPLRDFARATAVTLQPDGKIVLAAEASGGNDSAYAVGRLNANGTLDATFGSGGWWVYDPTLRSEVLNEVAVAPSGSGFSIYAAGYAWAADGKTDFAVVKLTSAGVPVAGFGTSGVAVHRVGVGVLAPEAGGMVVTPSGGVAVAGTAQVAAGAAPQGCVLVLTAAGQPDATFNGTGVRLDDRGDPTKQTRYYDIAAQGSNYVVVGYSVGSGGVGTTEGVIARYTSTGAIDTTFATNGYFVTTGTAESYTSFGNGKVKVAADGSLVVLGTANLRPPGGTGQAGIFLGRLSANGVPDATFGSAGTGFVTGFDLDLQPGLFVSLTLDQFGNILVGSASRTGYRQGVIVRFTGS